MRFIAFVLISILSIAQANECTPDEIENIIQGLKPIDQALKVIPSGLHKGMRVFSLKKEVAGTIIEVRGNIVVVKVDGLGDSGEVINYGIESQVAKVQYEVSEKKFKPAPGQNLEFPTSDLLPEVKFLEFHGQKIPLTKNFPFIDVKQGLLNAIQVEVTEAFSNGKESIALVTRKDWAIPRIHRARNSEVRLIPYSEKLIVVEGDRKLELKSGTQVLDKKSLLTSKIHSTYFDPVTKEEIALVLIPNYSVVVPRRVKDLGIPK